MANTHPQRSGENGFKSIRMTLFSDKRARSTLDVRIHFYRKMTASCLISMEVEKHLDLALTSPERALHLTHYE